MPITRSRRKCSICLGSLGAYIRIGAVITLGVYVALTIWELDRRSNIVLIQAPSVVERLAAAVARDSKPRRAESTESSVEKLASAETAPSSKHRGAASVSSIAKSALDTITGNKCKHVKVISAGKDDGNNAEFWLDGERIEKADSARGLNVVLIDPVSQDVISFENYDLYENAGPAKEKLAGDIDALKPGTIVLMGLMDTGLENLDTGMLEMLHDALGTTISRGSFRHGYALITSKCGARCEGTAIAEKQSPSVEVNGVLPCMKIWTTPTTSKPQLVAASNDCKRLKIRILSAGKDNGNVASFFINGKQIRGKPSSRGMNIVMLDPRDGKVLSKKAYDTFEQIDMANEKLFDDIEKAPVGTVVLAAAMDSGMENLDSYALDALQACGAVIWQGKFRTGYALIGVKGSKAVAEKMAPSVEVKGELPCPPPDYPHLPVAKNTSESLERSDEVLFTVVSDSIFFNTRIKWLLDTWGRDVPDGDLMIVADKPGSLPVKLVPTDCTKGTHDAGCCKFGHAVFAASQHLETDPKLEWFYFADDDVYVRPIHMKKRLAKRRVTKWPVAKGLLGCSNDKCHGICGGGGFLLNRKGLLKLVGNDTRESFVGRYMKSCLYCSHWGDLAVSKMIQDRGVKLENMKGLHPWRLGKPDFIDQLRSSHPPVTFHYMRNLEQLQTLHRMFSANAERGKEVRVSDKIGDDSKYACINFYGEKVCAKSGADPHVPWR